MFRTSRRGWIVVALAVLLQGVALGGCGSGAPAAASPAAPSLDDAAFATTAGPACAALRKAIVVLPRVAPGVDYWDVQADDYQSAAETLAGLSISAASAPNATAVRSGIVALAQQNRTLASAVTGALTTSGMTRAATLVIAEDGRLFAYETSEFDMTDLKVDPSLLTAIHTTQQQVADAAGRLGLTDCVLDSWIPSASGAAAASTAAEPTAPSATADPTPSAETPVPSATEAIGKKLRDFLVVYQDGDEAVGVVGVEVTNISMGWIDLQGGTSGYTIVDAAGDILVFSAFIYAYPRFLAPGQTGYLADRLSEADFKAQEAKGVESSPGFVAVDASKVVEITAELGANETREDTGKMSSTGTVTNHSSSRVDSVHVGAFYLDAAGSVIGFSSTNLVENVEAEQTAEFSTLPNMRPVGTVAQTVVLAGGD